MQYRLLGGLAVHDDGTAVDLGGPKQRTVLAALLLERGRPVATARLVDLVWGDDPPARAEASLQAYVSNLRKALEPGRRPRDEPAVLIGGSLGYTLVVPDDEVDVARFEVAAAEGRRALAEGRPSDAATALDGALALWRGPMLPELDDRPWVVAPGRRVAEVHAGVVEDRAEAALALGRPGDVAALVQELVVAEPHRERLRRLQAVALYRSGRQRDALAVLEQARQALLEDAGLEPSRELRELEQAMLRQDPELDGPTTPSTATTGTLPGGRDAGPPAPASIERPFVGRGHELAVLTEAFAAAGAGAGRPVVVSGEPGIGKTRLVEELAALAEGAVVAWARCPESAAQAAYWPCVQLGRQLADAGVAADALTAALPAEHRPGAGDAVVDRLALHGMAADVIVSAGTPLVLVVDDLQWADPASLRLLEYLAGELRRSRCLLVVTVRPTGPDAPEPLLDLLAELARQPGAVRLDLAGLSTDDVSRLLALRAVGHVDPRVSELVHDRTGGNAFFVGEVVELLSSEGELGADDALRGGAVPAAVQDVVRRRVGQLPGTTQQLLTAASVVGRTFDLDVLGRVAQLDAAEVLDRLDPALDAGIVVESDRPGRFQFSHALVADSLTAELSAVRRARAHAAVAAALTELRPNDLDEDVVALAHHAFEGIAAGTAPEAHRWSVRAAELASARLAHEDAAQHWLRAARAAQVAWPRDPTISYRALLEAGRSWRAVDSVSAAYGALIEAIDIGLAAGDTEMVLAAAAEMNIDGLWLAGEIASSSAEALGALQRAVAATTDGPVVPRALALGALAENAFGQLSIDEIDRVSAEALRLARESDDPQVIALTLHKRNQALWSPRSLEPRRAAAEELVALVEAPGASFPPALEAVAQFGAASVDWELGDTTAARRRVERARALAGTVGAPALVTQIDFFCSALLIARGELRAAEQVIEQTYELYRRTRRWAADAFRAGFLTVAWVEEGRLDDIVQVAPDILDSVYALAFGEAVAFAYFELGAAELAAPLVVDLPPLFDSWMLLGIAAVAAHNRVAVGDRAGAEVLHQVLLPYSGRLAVPGTGPAMGDVDLALARIERMRGDDQAARTHLDRSVDLLTRADLRPWLVRALLERHSLTGDDADLDRAASVVAGTELTLLRDRVAALQAGSK